MNSIEWGNVCFKISKVDTFFASSEFIKAPDMYPFVIKPAKEVIPKVAAPEIFNNNKLILFTRISFKSSKLLFPFKASEKIIIHLLSDVNLKKPLLQK